MSALRRPEVIFIVTKVDQIDAMQIENVVRIKNKTERVSGSFLLFATHFIFVDSKNDEIWVCVCVCVLFSSLPLSVLAQFHH